MSRGDVLLRVEDLTVSYGNIRALNGISFEVRDGEIVTLIGANGAGKSSALRALSGLVPFSGRIFCGKHDLSRISPDGIVRLGIAQVPEGRGIFGNLTVLENLKLATWQRRDKADMARDYKRVFALFPRLDERKDQLGGTLSGGEQQMLAVGRGLMSRPKLLMMDEPSLGLAPLIVKMIFEIIKQINAEGTTVLLVEQNAKAALEVADYGYVLETGRITLQGKGQDLLQDDRVRKAYLGEVQ
jgi:branched-chain amino acid transport system ATP-binding protein